MVEDSTFHSTLVQSEQLTFKSEGLDVEMSYLTTTPSVLFSIPRDAIVFETASLTSLEGSSHSIRSNSSKTSWLKLNFSIADLNDI